MSSTDLHGQRKCTLEPGLSPPHESGTGQRQQPPVRPPASPPARSFGVEYGPDLRGLLVLVGLGLLCGAFVPPTPAVVLGYVVLFSAFAALAPVIGAKEAREHNGHGIPVTHREMVMINLAELAAAFAGVVGGIAGRGLLAGG